MTESIVRVSMRDDNDLDCSYAIVGKEEISVIILLKDSECAIFDYHVLKNKTVDCPYLLLKHYESDADAYRDFLKLIGKMCKKEKSSKYFLARKEEDNRMVFYAGQGEHMITREDRAVYQKRFALFNQFVLSHRGDF